MSPGVLIPATGSAGAGGRHQRGTHGRGLVLGLAVLATVGGLGAAQGGYFASTWGLTGLVLLWAVAIGVLALHRVHGSGLETITLGALGLFLAVSALSVLWSLDPAQSLLEVQRDVVYLAGLAALLLFARRDSVGPVLAALTAACSLVSVYALATLVLSEATVGAGPARLDFGALSAPIGYSGALGLFAAMGSLLALGFATRSKGAASRALAAAALVPLASTLSLAASRAGFAALAVGLAVAVGLSPRRREVLVATAAALPAPLLAALISATDAAAAGRGLAPALLVLAAGSAALSLSLGMGEKRPRARLVTGAIAALLLLAGPTVASTGGSSGAPVAGPVTARDALDPGRARRSLEVRMDLWEVAWRSARSNPLLGSGAGSFGRWWLERRQTPRGARDAHNLYLETLGELGAVGLGLLLLVLGAPLLAAARLRRHPLVPAAAGAYVAYLAHAGSHPDWEMPVLTLTALSCGATVLVAARRDTEGRAVRAPARATALAAALALGVFAFVGVAGNAAMARSHAAAAVGALGDATAQARTAARWMSWSGEPWRVLGEAALAEGDVALARARFRRGLRRDPRSWRLWSDLSQASGGRLKRAAAARAGRLNPLAQVDAG